MTSNNIDDFANLFAKLDSGEQKLYKLETLMSKSDSLDTRRAYIEHNSQVNLNPLSNYEFSADKIFGKNCENAIGGLSIPVGIAGPIKVSGNDANGEYYVPFATTEGALVASINRGAKVVNLAGGVTSISTYVGITRAPLYRLDSIKQVVEFKKWIELQKEKITQIADESSTHTSLLDFKTYSNGKNVWVRFRFDTGDAMGMNMAVIASKKISQWMEGEFSGLRTISISGNLCVDKKPAYINILEGRGRIVETEITLPKSLVESELNTTVEQIIEVTQNKMWVGGMMSGSMGFNAHIANVMAGIYIATGQDPAQVVGGSLGSTTVENDNGDLYMNTRIPAVNVATVGGGTGLPTQNSLQKLMLTDLSKDTKEKSNHNKTNKLAEILGAAVLAGELSLVASFASSGFVDAHKNFGRNGK